MANLSLVITFKILTFIFVIQVSHSEARDFSVQTIMQEFEPEERFAFISGVVEGLAYARFLKDGKDTEGMGCIYRWFYNDQSAMTQVYQAFDRFPDHPPGAVIGALIKLKCGA